MSDARRRRLLSATTRGRPELVAALTLGAILTTAHLDRHSPSGFLLLDLGTCAAAGLSAMFPRVGSAAVIASLVIYLTLPVSWVTVGEVAFLIPVVSLIRLPGEGWRLAYTATGLILLCFEATLEAGAHAMASVVLWLGLTCLAWAAGTAIKRIGERHVKATETALAEQRKEIARDLHDTLSHQLTQLAWRTELIRDRGYAVPEDLDVIASAAHRSAGDIRTLIAMDATASTRGNSEVASLSATLAALDRRLTASGFKVKIFREDDNRLAKTTLETIEKILTEIANNIERHAPVRTDVSVIVTFDMDYCEIAVLNEIQAKSPTASESCGRPGIAGMRARAQAIGGVFETGEANGLWMTHLRVPARKEVC